ncbi:uncharacterized protein F4807DRAFT_135899 [Annulohypoxylon truncatum]|uniref:uncharacterized protein n=1 Tax=Annulohypoxylon truncatum TaxID=327061 RepID=UPI00200873FC|nr:uncharacterized protein F4807DRAFT_135899 [Annulohypoxylon truncatum]KAI1208850.1 hypothetical protein F4807DRAFT_135899 [Annulohypoxylon truncatum]
MAIKHLALLALVGGAFAQTSMDDTATSLTDISPASDATATDMSDSMMTTTVTDISATTSVSTEVSVSSSETSSASVTVLTSTLTASSMSSMSSDSMGSDMSSMASETGTGTTAGVAPVGTGGVASNGTGSGSTPVAGDAVMTGVSVGLFIVSVALTALIQL